MVEQNLCNTRPGPEYRFGQGLMIKQQLGRTAQLRSQPAHAPLTEYRKCPDIPAAVAPAPATPRERRTDHARFRSRPALSRRGRKGQRQPRQPIDAPGHVLLLREILAE